MVVFNVNLNDSSVLKLEVVAVSNVIYLRTKHDSKVLRGYILSGAGDDIFALKPDCKFPEQPVVEEIPIEVCTLLVQ